MNWNEGWCIIIHESKTDGTGCYPLGKIGDADWITTGWTARQFSSYTVGGRNVWKIPWKVLKQFSCTASFELKVIKHARKHGNRAAERRSGPPSIDSVSRLGRQQEAKSLQMPRQKKAMWGEPPKWPEVEQEVKTWILEQRQTGISVSAAKMMQEEGKGLHEKVTLVSSQGHT